MSERSGIWKKKKQALNLKEERLREELEDASDEFENRAKTVAKVVLITGGVLLASYGLYKMLSPKKTEEKPRMKEKVAEQPPTVKVKSGFSLKNILLERVALVAIGFIGEQLTRLLSQKFTDSGSETNDDEDNVAGE